MRLFELKEFASRRTGEFVWNGIESLEGRELYSASMIVNPGLSNEFIEGDAGNLHVGGLTPTMEEIFTFHSNPGATRTIYLDFDGHVTTDTEWKHVDPEINEIISLPFDVDGNIYEDPEAEELVLLDFTDDERTMMYEIWARMAEDFLPFDVDVTTEQPPEDPDAAGTYPGLFRADGNDEEYGIRVVISESIEWFGEPAGGVAFLGIFDEGNDTPTFVFTGGTGLNAKSIAEAGTHEVGHTMGLEHDGQFDGLGNEDEYYAGHGDGPTSWGPIMGGSYAPEVTQWSKGEYARATNSAASDGQDDLEVLITQNGFDYRVDEVVNDFLFNLDEFDRSEALWFYESVHDSITGAVDYTGIIERNDDVDMFYFETDGGEIDLLFEVAAIGANLDIEVRLYTANGTLVEIFNPRGELGVHIQDYYVQAGGFYIGVDGVGEGNVKGTGYSDYGSLGFYRMTGTISPLDLPAPIVELEMVTDEDTPIDTVDLTAALIDALIAAADGYDYSSVTLNVTSGFNGSTVLNSGGSTVNYTPNLDYHGDDYFYFFITNGAGEIRSGLMNITVNSVLDAATVLPDSGVGFSGGALSVDLLGNDTHVEELQFSITSVTNGQYGSVTFNANGYAEYVSDSWFVGEDMFTYTVTDSDGRESTSEVYVSVSRQGLYFERFDDILGTDLNSFKYDPRYPYTPDVFGTVIESGGEFEIDSVPDGPLGSDEVAPRDYGMRLRGYLTPLVSGTYTFYVSGGIATELRMSEDTDSEGTKRIAYSNGPTGHRDWHNFNSQTSKTRELVAGERYFIEALFKDAAGDGELSVGWAGPGIDGVQVIGGEFLTAFGIDPRIEGDANGDGVVNIADKTKIINNFGNGIGLGALFSYRNAVASGLHDAAAAAIVPEAAALPVLAATVAVAVEEVDVLYIEEAEVAAEGYEAAAVVLSEGEIAVETSLGEVGDSAVGSEVDRDTSSDMVSVFDLLGEEDAFLLI